MPGDEQPKREVIEVEVERLPEGSDGRPLPDVDPTRPLPGRRRRTLGPVMAGVIVDLVDLLTLRGGPLGLVLGAFAGYTVGRNLGLARQRALTLALLAGVYCALPLTPRLPLASLVGILARVMRWS